MYTKDYILKALHEDAKALGSQKALAEKIGISPAYLTDILKNRREPGPAVLRYLGLQAQTIYTEVSG